MNLGRVINASKICQDLLPEDSWLAWAFRSPEEYQTSAGTKTTVSKETGSNNQLLPIGDIETVGSFLDGTIVRRGIYVKRPAKRPATGIHLKRVNQSENQMPFFPDKFFLVRICLAIFVVATVLCGLVWSAIQLWPKIELALNQVLEWTMLGAGTYFLAICAVEIIPRLFYCTVRGILNMWPLLLVVAIIEFISILVAIEAVLIILYFAFAYIMAKTMMFAFVKVKNASLIGAGVTLSVAEGVGLFVQKVVRDVVTAPFVAIFSP